MFNVTAIGSEILPAVVIARNEAIYTAGKVISNENKIAAPAQK